MTDVTRLQKIKEIIEGMNKSYQIEILKLLVNNSAIVSENSNGTFVNLTDLTDIVIIELEKYIEFVNEQQQQLLYIEKEKATIKKEFFKQEKRNVKLKQNKEEANIIVNE